MKTATRHWWLVRLTSLPLVPLFIYFITQLEHLASRTRVEFTHWLQQPVAACAVAAFIACAFYHATLGMDEIIEDYVSAPGVKSLSLKLNRVSFLVLGVLSLYALWHIYNGQS